MKFEISNIEVNDSVIESVDARELHAQLEIKTPYSMWMSRRIEQMPLEEEIDFITINRVVNGNKQIDHFLTIATAKHIAMAERNGKGKEVRNYFINVEAKAKKLEAEKLLTLESQVKQLEANAKEAKAIRVKEVYTLIDVQRYLRANYAGTSWTAKKVYEVLVTEGFINKLIVNDTVSNYRNLVAVGAHVNIDKNIGEYIFYEEANELGVREIKLTNKALEEFINIWADKY